MLRRLVRGSSVHAARSTLLGAHDWHLFMPTKRHAANLNEKVVFLMLGNTLVGAILAMKDMLHRRETVKWPTKVVSLSVSYQCLI